MKLLKWGLAILAVGFLGYEIFVKNNAIELFSNYKEKVVEKRFELMVVVLLMPINWLIDALKWRWLLRKHVEIRPMQAFKGIFMGLSVGLFTPNGVGEFFGRMLAVRPRFRQQAVAASITGSLAQLAITITIGGACLVFMVGNYIAPTYLVWVRILAVVTIGVGFYAYFKLPEIFGYLLTKVKRVKRFAKFQEAFASFTKQELLGAYGFALARYVVFCTQLFIVLFAVGDIPTNNWLHLVWLIPVYYYVQTLVPTVALSEIGVRGVILSFLLADYVLESDVILASFIIWIVNLILPGLIGLIVLLRTKIKLGK